MRNAAPTRLGAFAVALLLAVPTIAASAANEYDAPLRARQFAEVEKAASARLAREPSNPDAMIARANAIVGQDPGRIDEGVAQAEKCVAVHPQNGRCHLALGQALGTKAMIRGIMASLGSAGTIRESLKKAVELDPANVDARFTMLDYYMMAPFVVGGGKGKAEAFVKDTEGVLPEAAKLMRAKMLLGDGDAVKAEAAALAVKPGADEDMVEHVEDLLSAIGADYVSDKKFTDADRVLREAQKRYPNSNNIQFMAGRLQQEQGRHREAIAILEKVEAKMPRPHVHYRLGKSFQALGEKVQALAWYEKALASRGLSKSQRTQVEDELKRLRG